jgi:hypothetical protein
MDCVAQQTVVILGVLSRKQCLQHAKYLKGLVVSATDGRIGSVDSLYYYFDDETLAGRYLMVPEQSGIEIA